MNVFKNLRAVKRLLVIKCLLAIRNMTNETCNMIANKVLNHIFLACHSPINFTYLRSSNIKNVISDGIFFEKYAMKEIMKQMYRTFNRWSFVYR